MVFVYYKCCSDCCGESEGDASFVLLRFVLFVNKVLTLLIYENYFAIVLETMYNINKCNSSNIKTFSLAPRFTDSRYYGH